MRIAEPCKPLASVCTEISTPSAGVVVHCATESKLSNTIVEEATTGLVGTIAGTGVGVGGLLGVD
jgi:hypothetical protein